MSRAWKIGIGLVVALVAVNLVLRYLGSVTGGTPGGPESSSYATASDGAAAYAELLGRTGHRVDQLRDAPHRARLASDETAIVLDPLGVANLDADALRAFVAGGGRLVAGGDDLSWLGRIVEAAPAGEITRGVVVRAGKLTLRTAGSEGWRTAGSMHVVAAQNGGVVVASERVGDGIVFALADPSPLQNRLLDRRDNAAFGLRLAGAGRRVAFLETYHGYGRSSGLRALPLAWILLLSGLALAGIVYLVARGRRLGPPELTERDLPPPRREYVDSLAGVLARTTRDEAIAPVRRSAREALLRRAALPEDAGEDAVREAARRLGLADTEANALLAPARTDDDVLAVGRALARIGQDPR
jgi:hypothetical protein